MDWERVVEDLKLCARRVARSDFLREHATDAEVETLAAAARPVESPHAQDYAAWRRSVLLFAAVVICLAALFQIVGFETVEDQGARMALSAQPGADEDAVRRQIRANFGEDNLDIVDLIPILSLLSVIVSAVFVVLAARAWGDVPRSRRFSRIAWYVLVGTPLATAIIPWARMLDFSHLPPAVAQQRDSAMGVALGLQVFFMLAPKLLAVFPGLIRSSITLKTLLHESATPGYTAAIFAPVYVVFLVVVFTTINQIQGNLILMGGVAGLAIAPLVYIYRGRDLLRSHAREEAETLVAEIRRTAFIFNLIGMVLVVAFIFTLEQVSFFTQVEFFLSAGAGLLLVMVVACDFVIALLSKEYEQSKQLQSSTLAADLETKLAGLAAAGMGTISTKDEDESPPDAGGGEAS